MVEELGQVTKQVAAEKLAAVRQDYEDGELSIDDLAAKHGITRRRVFELRNAHGWKPRRGSVRVDRADLIKTMLLVLKRQLSQLERDMTVPGDKEAAVLASLARSLEKLIKLDKVESAAAGQQISRMEHARLKLIRRMAELGKT
jgi:hypothetical protein